MVDKIEKKVDRRAEKKESIMQAALKLFSLKGFHGTTIPDIASKLKMSSGNMYNYFPSKDMLAKEIIHYTTAVLGGEIKKVNIQEISTELKIRGIVEIYFAMAQEKPEMIDYFLRVYLANREIFSDGCEEMTCVSGFINEIMIFFKEGVASGDLRDQDFFSAFGLFMGYLGGMVFLRGESVLPEPLESYIDAISTNIYYALKV